MIFKSNHFDHVSGNKEELRDSNWKGIGLTVEVNGEGKRHMAWKKGGLKNSIWVSKGQREHVVGPSGSRVHTLPVVGSDQQMGLPVIHFPEPPSPSRLVVGVSPNVGVKRPLIQEAHSPARSKTSHIALDAQDDTGAVGEGRYCEITSINDDDDLGGSNRDELVSSEKAGTMVMNSVGQTEMNWCPTMAPVELQCPMSDGFHGGDSSATLATLGRADVDLSNTKRTILTPFPLTEPLGCLAETSAEAISDGICVDEPMITMGKANTEGERALKGLVLSNYVMSSPRVGLEDLGVSGGDEGGRVKGASDIQGFDASQQANQSELALIEGLGDVVSSSPLMTINPLELVVIAELNSNSKVMGFDNSSNVSKWVKQRLPGLSKMMGLPLCRHKKVYYAITKT